MKIRNERPLFPQTRSVWKAPERKTKGVEESAKENRVGAWEGSADPVMTNGSHSSVRSRIHLRRRNHARNRHAHRAHWRKRDELAKGAKHGTQKRQPKRLEPFRQWLFGLGRWRDGWRHLLNSIGHCSPRHMPRARGERQASRPIQQPAERSTSPEPFRLS